MGSRSRIWLGALAMAPLLLVLALVLLAASMFSAERQAQDCSGALPGSDVAATGGIGVGSLNWRGASHLHKDPHPHEQPYFVRMPYMIRKVNSSGASIIGFQEFETKAARMFLHEDPAWGLVRGTHSSSGRGGSDSRDGIAYLRSKWTPSEIRYISIAYAHRGGGARRISIPLVKFTSNKGDGSLWIANTHNPASAHGVGGSEGERLADTVHEAQVLGRLAAQSGLPVLFTGDMNDHQGFARTFLSHAGPGWRAANPGRGHIDWIMGSPTVRFANTVIDHSTNDGAHHYTDHPFVHTQLLLPHPAAPAQTKPPATPAGAEGRPAAGLTLSADKTTPQATTSLPRVPGFSADQITNAAKVVAAGKALGVPARGLAIGLMTAYGESGLHNISHGDSAVSSSRGIFQQLANGAWGTLAQRMNPYAAATSFFKALLKVDGWQSMSPTAAAHAVQGNADPNYDTPYWPKGEQLLGALGGRTYQLAAASVTGCDPTGLVNTSFGTAAGGAVGPFSLPQLLARIKELEVAGTFDPFFHAVTGGWHDKCEQFVAILDGRPHSGFTTAADGWATLSAAHKTHPASSPGGASPPVGAWLYYAPNHVAVYLGNGQVASTDVFGDGRVGTGLESAITDGPWHLHYLGWVTPWGAT